MGDYGAGGHMATFQRRISCSRVPAFAAEPTSSTRAAMTLASAPCCGERCAQDDAGMGSECWLLTRDEERATVDKMPGIMPSAHYFLLRPAADGRRAR